MRLQKGAYLLFHAAFGALLLALLGRMVLSWQYNGTAALLAGAVLGCTLALALRYIAPTVDGMGRCRFARTFGAVAVAYFVLLLILGNAMAEVLISDMGVVYDTLPEFLRYGHPVQNNDYYIICANNLGLALVLAGFYAVAGLFGIAPDDGIGIAAGISFNCLCIFAAVLLLCAAVHCLTERKSAALLLLCCAVLFAPLYLWAPYFYSDTVCLPFLAGAVLLFARWQKQPTLGLAAAFGACSFAGYAVKGSLAVLPVAALVAGGVTPPRDIGTGRRLAASAAALLLGFGLCFGGYEVFRAGYLDWTNKDSVALPTELWLCYGSHENGDYNETDAQDCIVQPALADRTILMRQRIAENYGARTPVGNLDFMLRKAVYTWGDGEYGAQPYLATPLHSNFTARFTQYGQAGFMPLLYYCQAWQYMLLLMCGGTSLAAALTALRGGAWQYDGAFFARVALFGVMLFLSFWETKARYGLHFAPVLLLCVVAGLMRFVPRRAAKRQETKLTAAATSGEATG